MAVPWKAVYGFVVGMAGSTLAFVQDGNTSLESMTATQWIIVVLTGIVTSGGVYALPK